MPELVLLRHGQSTWNAEDRFTGWVDVDLSPKGEEEARLAGRRLRQEQLAGRLDLRSLHTSLLTRTVRTATLALEELGRTWLPVQRHWRLNERHYGDLQGRNKHETADRYGPEQVHIWRRSYATRPPALPAGESDRSGYDLRYEGIPASAIPTTECLGDVVTRLIPYWEDVIVPDLLRHREGTGVLVVAHGNSLRALVKHLKGVSDEDIVDLEIPTGVPWWFRLDADLSLREDRLLDIVTP